ncbi:neocarzinostatin apoprotein domain-containing protein, partial [Streptomyces lunaelactis]|uniref:neocarzinostatin apoprotein domain-containing protein n=1 Tax=Streptomyces lunaelactis TaxID=1535768 RepID=UPI0020C7A3FF
MLLLLAAAPPASAADTKPGVKLSRPQAGKGGDITVSGSGWRPDTLLMMLICGQAAPDRGVIGGTNSCANADGRAVTTDANGSFSKKMPVAEPPRPCPCV